MVGQKTDSLYGSSSSAMKHIWWLGQPEKYEVVSWDDDIPN